MNDEVEKNISLGFEFLRHLIEHPEMVTEIPDGAEIEFIGPNLTTTESKKSENKDSPKFLVSTKRTFEAVKTSDGLADT